MNNKTSQFLLFFFLSLTFSIEIPYQAHGFNDLPYLLQLLKKGVKYFKMDVSPATKDSCLQYSQWDESNQCEIYENGFNICCLAFRGDTSSIPIFRQPFNITSEFLKLIEENQELFQERLVFAFDFQYNDIFSTLTKQFLLDLKTISENYNIDILTHSFFLEYIEKCKIECDEIERKIASSNFYLQTSSPIQNNDRELNYNTFYQNIELLCDIGWPEWVGKFSAIFWEPSHEYQVQKIRKYFYDPECKIPERLRNIDNLKIASNLEPETFQIFWKQINTQQIYNPKEEKKIMIGQFETPKIEYDNHYNHFIISYYKIDESQLQIYIVNENHEQINFYSIEGNYQNLKYMKLNNDLLLLQTENQVKIFKIQETSLEPQQFDIELKQYSRISLLNNDYFVILQFQDNTIQFLFYKIENFIYTFDGSFEIPKDQINEINLISLSFDSILYNNEIYIVISYTLQDNLKLVYMKLIKATINDYIILQNTIQNNYIDYGEISEIKLFILNNNVFISSIQQNGICQSAILLNNNEWNKCGYLDPFEYKGLMNVEYILDYFYGSFENIFQIIESKQQINGCNFNIMHGKLGNGKNPSFTIKDNEMFVVTEYISYSQLPIATSLFCGSQNEENYPQGLLYFSFDLVDPKLL